MAVLLVGGEMTNWIPQDVTNVVDKKAQLGQESAKNLFQKRQDPSFSCGQELCWTEEVCHFLGP